MSEGWKLKPIKTTVVDILVTRGALTYEELSRELRKEDGFGDVSEAELMNCLMALEVGGLVRVTTFAKGSKRIEPVTVASEPQE